MNGRQFQDTKIQNGLVFSDLRGKNRVQLPKVFTSEDLSQREDLFPQSRSQMKTSQEHC